LKYWSRAAGQFGSSARPRRRQPPARTLAASGAHASAGTPIDGRGRLPIPVPNAEAAAIEDAESDGVPDLLNRRSKDQKKFLSKEILMSF
jgi:hypothetical protein